MKLNELHEKWMKSGRSATADEVEAAFAELERIDSLLTETIEDIRLMRQRQLAILFSYTGTDVCFKQKFGSYLIPWQRGGQLGFQQVTVTPAGKGFVKVITERRPRRLHKVT